MGLMTFKNLPKEKRLRILSAAKKEFSRVPLNKALISNIVKDARIPRGSFYQYFDSIDELFLTLINFLYGREPRTLFDFLEINNNIFMALKNKFAYTLDRLNDDSVQFKINLFNIILLNKNNLPSIIDMKVEIDYKNPDELLNLNDAEEMLKIIEMINLTCISRYLLNNESKELVKEAYNKYIDLLQYSINNMRK